MVVVPYASRWPLAAQAGTYDQLLDALRRELNETIQIRWGCRRVREERGYRVVGAATVPPERKTAWDADHLAADLAFLDFLRRAWVETYAAGLYLVRADLDVRIRNWVDLLTPAVEAMATEMVTLCERWRKADALDAAGQWTPDKTPIYLAITARVGQLYDLLDYHAPALIPAGMIGDQPDAQVAA